MGLGKLEASINTFTLVATQLQLFGSAAGTKEDIEETMTWMASGNLDLAITEIDFEQIAEDVDQLVAGTAVSRLVARVAD